MSRLKAAWRDAPAVQTLAKAFTKAKVPLRFVGGCVRDSVLGRTSSDLDAATPATPDEIMTILEKSGIRAIPTGIAYGTVTALIDNFPIQITTLRKDIATDGRHPEVAYTDDWQQDAARRDFTMNALYMGLDGTLYDYHGGIADAKAGHVRFIGEATARIREDYLRILRFFRFTAHFGKGKPDALALAACKKNVAGIGHLSGERIQYEMMKLLAAPRSADILLHMHDASVLSRVCLDFREIDRLRTLENCPYFVQNPLPSLLKLAALLPDESSLATLARRWKLSNQDKRTIHTLHSHAAKVHAGMSLAEQKRAIRLWGGEAYVQSTLLAYSVSGMTWKRFAPLLTMASWQAPKFPLTGQHLKECGVPAGKAMGATLKRLEDVWEKSDYRYSKEDLLRLI